MFSLFSNKNAPMKVRSQIFVQGREPFFDANLPVFVTNTPYLKMRYNEQMPVTASAYISLVTLGSPIKYFSSEELEKADRETDKILVVGQKFLALPLKQQLALLNYEYTRNSFFPETKMNMGLEEEESIVMLDVDGRKDTISQYGKAGKKVLAKVEKLDRKGQIKTGKVLKKEMKKQEIFKGKKSTTDDLVGVMNRFAFGLSDSTPSSDDNFVGLEDIEVLEPDVV